MDFCYTENKAYNYFSIIKNLSLKNILFTQLPFIINKL